MFALAIGASCLQAAGTTAPTITSNAPSGKITLGCNTQTGTQPVAVTFNLNVLPSITTGTGSSAVTTTATSVAFAINLPTPANGLQVSPKSGVFTTANTGTSAAGLTFIFTLAPGCNGVTAGTPSLTFTATNAPSSVTTTVALPTIALTVNANTVATKSALNVPASPVVLTCYGSGAGAYTTAGPNQTVSITSTAIGGTPFYIDNVTTGLKLPAFVDSTKVPITLATSVMATASGAQLTFTPVCTSSTAAATGVATLVTLGPNATINLTLQVASPPAVSVDKSSYSLSYTKSSGVQAHVDVVVSRAAASQVLNPVFTVDGTTLPQWLTVDRQNAPAPYTLRFTTTNAADSLNPGNYPVIVQLDVPGYAPVPVNISLQVSTAPTLSVTTIPSLTSAGFVTLSSYVAGSSTFPTLSLVLTSSDTPIPYSIATGGALMPQVSASQGLAYNMGTTIPVTFSNSVFGSAVAGTMLTGTLTITYGSLSTVSVVNISIPVVAAGASLSSISPVTLPTGTTGLVTLYLTGTGFIQAGNPSGLKPTVMGIVKNVSGVNVFQADSNVVMGPYVNPSTMQVNITVPTTTPDANLPFTTGGTVTFGVCNPSATSACTGPAAGSGLVTLNISPGPVIQAVTSASSFVQQNVAPYDLISIFGTGLCGTACTAAQPTISAALPSTMVYPTILNPGNISVTFYKHSDGSYIGNAPMLFASVNQINAVVPAAVCTQATPELTSGLAPNCGAAGLNNVDIVVTAGTSANSNSIPYTVSVQPTDVGIFTVGADGSGDGAILKGDYSPVNSNNPAGVRSTAADSDVVQIYLTGLGMPSIPTYGGTTTNNWVADNTLATSNCATAAAYLADLNAAQPAGSPTIASIDGAVIQSAVLNAQSTVRSTPCLVNAIDGPVSVTVGGAAVTDIEYAGWVPDSITGLYQINVKLPGSGATYTVGSKTVIPGATPVSMPLVVTLPNSGSPAVYQVNQVGVNIAVSRQLKVVGPSNAASPDGPPVTNQGLTGAAGAAWTSNATYASITASEGNSPYSFAVTSGVLPNGLSLVSTSASSVIIQGTPGAFTAGVYPVTVTASDSSPVPFKGTVSFTLTVTGGLVMSMSNGNPIFMSAMTAGVPYTADEVQATGGTPPYNYVLHAATPWVSVDPITGAFTLNPSGGTGIPTAGVPADVQVDATDWNGLSGSITVHFRFDHTLAMTLTPSGAILATSLSTTVPTTAVVQANGGTGPYAYTIGGGDSSWLQIAGTGAFTLVSPGSGEPAASSGDKAVTVNATGPGGMSGSTTVHFTF